MGSFSLIGPPPIWLWNLGLAVPRRVLSCWWTSQLSLATDLLWEGKSELRQWNLQVDLELQELSHTSLPSHTQKPHPPPALLTKATSLRAAALRLSQWVGVRGRRRLKAAAAPDEPRWGDKKYELCLTTSIWGSCSEQEKWQFLLSMFCPACLLFVYFSLPVRLAFTKEWRKNTEKFSEREGRDGKTKKAALLQLPAFPNSVPARPALRQQFLCRYSYPSKALQRRLTATV